MGALRTAGNGPHPAEVDWLAPLATLVERAAKNAGMPSRRPQPGFDGEALIWSWRKYIGSEIVAADVRFRAWDDEASRLLHTTTVALAWPVDTRLRYMSRRVGNWSEDIGIDELTHRELENTPFADRLSQRLRLAWQVAERAAQDVLVEIRHVLPNDEAIQAAGVASGPIRNLTLRESQVLDYFRQGLTDREIGERLEIDASTVRTHINNILAKSSFSSRDQLREWAMYGWKES
jgi:DNA-binding CsgD family transcriptional regulator